MSGTDERYLGATRTASRPLGARRRGSSRRATAATRRATRAPLRSQASRKTSGPAPRASHPC
eukprot:1101333-Rhodomonas_salina.2